jgi:hypothetical protein
MTMLMMKLFFQPSHDVYKAEILSTVKIHIFINTKTSQSLNRYELPAKDNTSLQLLYSSLNHKITPQFHDHSK